jgi:hypothetical protein
MSWLVSILVGVITAAFGAIYAFFMAYAEVTWLRVTSFEGASGDLIVAMALVALIAGFGLGIGISRITGGPGWAGSGRRSAGRFWCSALSSRSAAASHG